jgi:hypothetical protein
MLEYLSRLNDILYYEFTRTSTASLDRVSTELWN